MQTAAHLVDNLLDACTRLRILATSREPLGVAGVMTWPVSPLSVPDWRREPTLAGLEGSESVRLFLERARLRDPSFALTRKNARAVAEVCRDLGGIPLAIELAAARVRALSVEQIAERLKGSLRLLSSGGQTAPSRHQTLRAALDWSQDLLGAQDRTLFRRLSVFAGGWSLAAAEAVGAGRGIEEDEVLDLLSGLVDKSLVTTKIDGGSEMRYEMLEPVRQYARGHLEDTDEEEEVRRLHAAYFLTLAEEAETTFWGPDEAEWLARLEVEHDNVRAALSWALAGGDAGLGLRLAGAVGRFWHVRGYLREGARWLEEALKRVEDAVDPRVRVAALSVLGSLYGQLAHYDRADAILGESLVLSRGLGDTFRMSDTLGRLGWLTIYRSDFVRAKAHFEESLAIAQESGYRLLVASALAGLGSTAVEGGDFERARRQWERALKIERELGSHSSVGAGSINRGFLELALGNFEQATAIVEEGLALGRSSGNKVVIAGCLHILGLIEALDGDPNRGQRLLVEALEITAELEFDRDSAESLEGIAAAAGALGQRARAARLWGAAESFRRTQNQPWDSVERMVYEPLLEAACTQTDPSIWDPAFAKGKAMGLEQAVQHVLSGARPAMSTPDASDQPAAYVQTLPLTRREQEIATLVTRGLTNRQIASELSISEHTAATHVRRILNKLGLRSRAQIGSWLTERRSPAADLD